MDAESAALHMQSWRPSTKAQYNIYLEKWVIFCKGKNIPRRKPSIHQIILFLTMLFNQGLSYSAINTARSALSSFVDNSGETPVGASATVCRHLRAIYNANPPKARYTEMWDVNTVLILLKKWYPNEQLDIQKLTFKTLMLLALVTAQRVQTLHAFMVSGLIWLKEEVILQVGTLLKHTRVGQKLDSFSVTKFTVKQVCPFRAFRTYVDRTKYERKEHDSLWMTLTKEPRPAGKDTVSRWLKTTMNLAGVDTSKFKAHSTRGSATSKVVPSLPVETILRRGCWTNARTFATFYKRKVPDQGETFQQAVLGGLGD
jgi:hypothetical protein